jgi:hypothetical protein
MIYPRPHPNITMKAKEDIFETVDLKNQSNVNSIFIDFT